MDAGWNSSETWRLENPSVSHDNLANSINTAAHQKAFWMWHEKLSKDIRVIVQAIEDQAGFDVVHEHIKRVFGDRAARAIQQNQLQRRNTERQSGTVTLLTASGAPMTLKSNNHQFFGD